MFTDEFFMKQALKEAEKAFDKGEVPVGAVVVCNDTIVARAYNQTELLNDVTAHAEILAITSAQEYLQSKFLNNCSLYVTLEPCLMCAGASYWARFRRVVFGAYDKERGYSKVKGNVFHPKTEVVSGILENECSALLIDFFKNKRLSK
jgi:tRNA(adenine34) deaminase